jgi:hypothetical protein
MSPHNEGFNRLCSNHSGLTDAFEESRRGPSFFRSMSLEGGQARSGLELAKPQYLPDCEAKRKVRPFDKHAIDSKASAEITAQK